MHQFRLIGTEKTMSIVAHSSLDAGARIKSDPDFYYVGTLERIEDLGGVIVAKVTAKGRIIPVSKTKEKPKKAENRVTQIRPEKPRIRERIIRKVFDFGF